MGKPFITVPHATRSVRMIELLKCLELDDRIVKDVNDLPVKHIDMDSSRYNISKRGDIKGKTAVFHKIFGKCYW